MVIQFLLLCAVLCQTQGFLLPSTKITLTPGDRKNVVVGKTLPIRCSKTESASSLLLKIDNTLIKSKILDRDTIGFHLESDRPILYVISCTDGFPDNTVFVQVRFGYQPKIDGIKYDSDASGYFMMSLTPVKNMTNVNDEYWNIKCEYTRKRTSWLSCNSNCNSTFCRIDAKGMSWFRYNITGNNPYGNISKSVTTNTPEYIANWGNNASVGIGISASLFILVLLSACI